MMNDLTWDEFCELYFDTAKKYAAINIQKLRKNNGEFDKRVDLDYVADAAVLSALEKVYEHFDSARGVKITTLLSTIVHNEIVDEVAKESKRASVQQDIDGLKAAIREYEYDGSDEARNKLIPRLRTAIAKLSPSDQVILSYYLADKNSYVAKSVQALNVNEGYVSVRRNRIFERLPKLMEMTRSQYRQFCYELEGPMIAGDSSSLRKNISRVEFPTIRTHVANPFMPSIDLDAMAAQLLALVCE